MMTVLLIFLLADNSMAEFVVSVRSPEVLGDQRENYNLALIQLVLDKTVSEFGGYELRNIPPMNGRRMLVELRSEKFVNPLVELNYEPQHIQIQGLSYIDFPIELGITGTRICFVSRQQKDVFEKVQSIEQLRAFSIGQGAGWVDSFILQHNHLKVMEVNNYNSLFRMVAAGRIDLLCRGINEIKGEYQRFGGFLPLIIDSRIALEYPLPRFFFTNAKNVTLKRRVERGLQLAWRDGTLVELWLKYFSESLDFVNMKNRKVFRLENPMIHGLSSAYSQYSYKKIVND
jgi:hypothetical protein